MEAMAAAADKLCGPEGTDPLMTRLALFGTKIRVAGFGGLRLGEQNALRAIDVFFEHGYVHVNGSWIPTQGARLPRPGQEPRAPRGSAAPVADARRAPPPRQGVARSAREGLTPAGDQRPGGRAPATSRSVPEGEGQGPRLVELPRPTRGEPLWLFVDTVTGLPVKPEMHNERWHRVRAWVEENDPDNAWPKTIVYRNLRHHAATKWFHEELGEPWEVVAQYLGDKLTTVLNHYVRAGEDALRDSVLKLSDR